MRFGHGYQTPLHVLALLHLPVNLWVRILMKQELAVEFLSMMSPGNR